MKYQVLGLQGSVCLIYLTSNLKKRIEDGQGVSETLMCNSARHTRTGTRTPSDWPLAVE